MTAKLVLCILLASEFLGAQSDKPVFEIVSIHSSMSAEERQKLARDARPPLDNLKFSGLRVELTNFSLKGIIGRAFPDDRSIVAPDWLASARFDVIAVMPENANRDQVPQMIRSMLQERFGLVTHLETIESPVMILGKLDGNSKLLPPTMPDLSECELIAEPSATNMKTCSYSQAKGSSRVNTSLFTGGAFGDAIRQTITVTPGLDGKNTRLVKYDYFGWTMTALAATLSAKCPADCLNVQVVDKTNISGKWDFSLERSCDTQGCEPWPGPLRKIGLKLDKGVVPLDRIIIDQISRTPTDN